jgi:formamidopyrimidine-DNA glycosylase
MFELPEYVHFAKQMNRAIAGKRIRKGALGNSPHKFVWYNQKPAAFERLTAGRTVGKAYARGRWLFLPLNPGYRLIFGECGGKILFHASLSEAPKKYHLLLVFDDGSALSAMTQMWGAMELYKAGDEEKRQYIRGMRLTPADPKFTRSYFFKLMKETIAGGKQSVKGLLTQNQLIPGLGNSIAQDILFAARLLPKRSLDTLGEREKEALYRAIRTIVKKVTAQGGRNDEYDLFGEPGGYRRMLDKNTAGKPCPQCGTRIQKIAYLGGSCYFCPTCQV